jgi:hypothetical protein
MFVTTVREMEIQDRKMPTATEWVTLAITVCARLIGIRSTTTVTVSVMPATTAALHPTLIRLTLTVMAWATLATTVSATRILVRRTRTVTG